MDKVQFTQDMLDLPPSQVDHGYTQQVDPGNKSGKKKKTKNRRKSKASLTESVDEDLFGIDCSQQNYVRTIMQGPDVGMSYTIDDIDDIPEYTRIGSMFNKINTPVNHLAPLIRMTPITDVAHIGSIKDRIKRTLAKNAKSSTTPSRVEQIRVESVAKALRDAEEIAQQGTKFDIGPFYGLPSIVKELFHKHRKIKSLYGKIFFY